MGCFLFHEPPEIVDVELNVTARVCSIGRNGLHRQIPEPCRRLVLLHNTIRWDSYRCEWHREERLGQHPAAGQHQCRALPARCSCCC